MPLSRRDFLKLGGITAVTTTAAACGTAGRQLNRQAVPETLTLPVGEAAAQSVERRFLNRAGYGSMPNEVARVQQMGLAAYLEEQLAVDEIEDTAVNAMLRSLSFYDADPTQLVEIDEQDALFDLIGSTLLRAAYSKKQLYEAMVEFWSDHFNIYARKTKLMPALKIMDDRDVIRPHALGKFRDLLWASAKSPAMLVYLDNIRNEKSAPNENYARELLELHTLGVDAPYTQQDVQEVARALTGWRVGRRGRNTGKTLFDTVLHDDGEKTVLGQTLPAGQGEADLDQVLEIVVTHPATAQFVATKLVRRFVADEPPQSLVTQVAATYQQTDGDIKAMLRVLFLSDEFATAPPKLKRPFTYFVSLIRALQINLRLMRGREIGMWLQRLGQVPFHWPPPNGYPDVSAAWASNLLPRWNLALTLLHGEGIVRDLPLEKLMENGAAETTAHRLELFSGLLYGRSLTPSEKTFFTEYMETDDEQVARLLDSAALMVASPAFQWT